MRVARVQLATARAGAADAGLAQHGLGARRAELSLQGTQLRVDHAEVRDLLLHEPAAVLIAAGRLVDETAEVAQRELASAAQKARAAADLATSPGAAASFEVLG